MPQFKHLQALLALIKPLLAEGEYDKIRKLLAEPAGTLDVLFRYKRLLMQWQLLHGTAGSTILQRPQLAEKLTEEIENILAEVAKQLEQGVYSHCIFKLLAWTEQSLWQNSYYAVPGHLHGPEGSLRVRRRPVAQRMDGSARVKVEFAQCVQYLLWRVPFV